MCCRSSWVFAALFGFLLTYPFGTLTILTLVYLGTIPLAYRRYARKMKEPVLDVGQTAAADERMPGEPRIDDIPVNETKH